ncbi:hypothetical protein RRG08_045492 [Elysia crispata]|uniref:Uncharacterized protein n=1 Tax=Elysia crispata TaxID=231223 RepID=A0AAE1DWY5_9GAST|nr:hypothetical protein RRG08_045492 [Elysia crispata]
MICMTCMTKHIGKTNWPRVGLDGKGQLKVQPVTHHTDTKKEPGRAHVLVCSSCAGSGSCGVVSHSTVTSSDTAGQTGRDVITVRSQITSFRYGKAIGKAIIIKTIMKLTGRKEALGSRSVSVGPRQCFRSPARWIRIYSAASGSVWGDP